MAVTRSTGKSKGKTTIVGKTAAKREPKSKTASSSGAGPERTPDGHFIIVNNRKWRATDPLIPEAELAELKHYLSLGRTGVRNMKGRGKTEEDDDIKLARKRTGLAKHGLGERGKPEWWNDTEDARRARWQQSLDELKALDPE